MAAVIAYKVESSLSGKVHIYPYMQVDPSGPSRTSDQLLRYSQEAVDLNYNIVQGNVIDYMHCVLLGVTKMLLQLWFNSKHSHELWYCIIAN